MNSQPIDRRDGRSRSSIRYDSPVGVLIVTATDEAVTSLAWDRSSESKKSPKPEQPTPTDSVLRETISQLDHYFANPRHLFDVPLAPAGTPFQRSVWSIMTRIPSGQTLTYGDVAARIGASGSGSGGSGNARAVGTACGANPIPIIIPCHRITAAGGRLGGFSGGDGVNTKTWLLTHERWPGLTPGPLFSTPSTAAPNAES